MCASVFCGPTFACEQKNTSREGGGVAKRIEMTASPLLMYNRENIILICGYLFIIEEAWYTILLLSGAPEAVKAEGCRRREGLLPGRGVNLHRPPCCSSPDYSLSLAQGTLFVHSTGRVYKTEHNVASKPFSPVCFHMLSIRELEHILHYF